MDNQDLRTLIAKHSVLGEAPRSLYHWTPGGKDSALSATLYCLPVLPGDLLHASVAEVWTGGEERCALVTTVICKETGTVHLAWLAVASSRQDASETLMSAAPTTTVGEFLSNVEPGTRVTVCLGDEILTLWLHPETWPIANQSEAESLRQALAAA